MLYRSTIVRMRFHQPTIDYVARRTAEGMPRREIIRCIKRFLAQEIYQRVVTDTAPAPPSYTSKRTPPSRPPDLAVTALTE